jgi:hypothetical protein
VWWFDGDREAARRNFAGRGGEPGAFDKQVQHIDQEPERPHAVLSAEDSATHGSSYRL